MASVTAPVAVASRPRAFVRVAGPQAGEFLQRMVSNDVEALPVGTACEALLLTPKGRVIAMLRVLRRGENDYLLLTEPELGDDVRTHLLRARFATRAEIELEEHTAQLRLGEGAVPESGHVSIPTEDYGVPGYEVLDADAPAGAERLDPAELERMRIETGTPRFGRDVDERVLPAEAGLVDRAVSFTKGCYPGQEPIARLHYRGHANRSLRVLRIEGGTLPPADAEILHDGRLVGRVTSAAPAGEAIVALGYVRAEVADEAELSVGGSRATMAPRRRP
jgi:folate-binding protein YgfZ